MAVPRLIHAVESGALTLPSGRMAVFGARAGADLPFPPDRVQIVTAFRPDHDWFTARGYDCVRDPHGEFAAALVLMPRARAAARGLVARAAAVAGMIIVEGAKTDGIDSLWRDLRQRETVDSLAKAHGRALWFVPKGGLDDWAAAAQPRRTGAWLTVPGAFSADGPDAGSQVLLAALPPLSGRIADMGAGWGYLSHGALAAGADIAEMHLVEADADALDCARVNVTDPRARFHWADALRPLPGAPFDAVVMNPPFHSSRAADPGLGRAFLAAAAAALKPRGALWLVANRHLPYDSHLSELFADVEDRPGTPAFKVFRAGRPRRRP